MTSLEIRNLATMVIMLIGAGGCFLYALTDQRRKAKKPVYAISGILFIMGAAIYSFAAFDLAPASEFRIWLKTGWLSAILFYLIVSAYIAIIITDWRLNERR